MRTVSGKVRPNTAESETLCMRGHPKRENREVLLASFLMQRASEERSENVSDEKSDMNASRNSDVPIVPAKSTNKTATAVAELVKERGTLKGSLLRLSRTRLCAGLSEYSTNAANTARSDGNVLTVTPERGAV